MDSKSSASSSGGTSKVSSASRTRMVTIAPSGRASPSTTTFPFTTVPVASCTDSHIHRLGLLAGRLRRPHRLQPDLDHIPGAAGPHLGGHFRRRVTLLLNPDPVFPWGEAALEGALFTAAEGRGGVVEVAALLAVDHYRGLRDRLARAGRDHLACEGPHRNVDGHLSVAVDLDRALLVGGSERAGDGQDVAPRRQLVDLEVPVVEADHRAAPLGTGAGDPDVRSGQRAAVHEDRTGERSAELEVEDDPGLSGLNHDLLLNRTHAGGDRVEEPVPPLDVFDLIVAVRLDGDLLAESGFASGANDARPHDFLGPEPKEVAGDGRPGLRLQLEVEALHVPAGDRDLPQLAGQLETLQNGPQPVGAFRQMAEDEGAVLETDHVPAERVGVPEALQAHSDIGEGLAPRV